MMSRQAATVSLCCLTGLAVLGIGWRQSTRGADDQAPRPAEVVDLMHEKLTNSHLILRGLIERDMNTVHAAGEDLVSLAKSAVWLEATDDPVYSHFNAEFLRLSERVVRMARNDNADGAAYAYQSLTTTCIACHEHVRDVTRLTRDVDE